VFLKSLTLKGFKSFADATEMALEPGVTVVVGPNGSGKSNVVDAVAWVLGAQAPKAVRSQKMDDVIFAGTAKRPALGRAEVSLTLDNSAGLLPVEFNEVTVTRILFRSGDSEYAINGVPCRLLDVQELLSDAGVGRQQHVIVSQGQIDAVLNARPEERRAIIEEAAGVLKFRKRKEKAERRLDATEANLLRLQDLVREVRRQLRPLERQAQAAQRHGDLQSELDALRVHVAGREIAAMRARLESIETIRVEAGTSEETAKSDLTRLDTEALAIEARLTARGEHDVRDQLVAAEQLRERARGLTGILAERRRGLERDRGQLMDAGLIATLEADVAGYQAELAEVLEGLAGFEPALAELTSEEEAFAAERDSAVAPTEEEPSTRAASAAAEVRGELRSVRASVDRTENERRRIADRLEQAVRRLDELDQDIERLRSELAEAAAGEGPLVEELTSAETERLAAGAEMERATTARQECAETRSRAVARAEALQMAVDSARARAGAERLVGVDGVLGTLLELVTIEDGWADAVEAALGDALAAVVVDGAGSARRALATLRGAGTTGAVIATGGAPREAVGPVDGASPLLGRVTSSSPGVPELLSSLLARAVVADDVDRAVDIALADPTLTVVTSEGDRFSPNGWRIGTSSGGATAAALADAIAAAEAAETALQAADRELAAASAELDRARSSEVEVGRRLDLNDGRFHAASEALESAQSRRRELAGERESMESALGDLVGHLEAERARIAEMEAVLPSLETDERAEAEAARRVREEQAAVETRAAVLASRRRDLEVRAAGLREREEFLRRRIAETEARLDADRDARSSAEHRRLEVERSLLAVERLSAYVSSRLVEIETIHAELSERRRRQSDEVREMTAQLDEVRRARVEAERSLEASRERAHRADLDEAEARLRLETAVETLRRDLDVEPEAAEEAPLPELPEGATAAGRVRELERELRLLGPINPLALEEFNELNQRHQFLEEQLEDVRSTRRDLNRVIAAIDGEIQTVFAAAFADVSTNFTQLFASLFPGGSGALRLTAPDDLLSTGIEVEAKPGGKNVKKLSLLSGGERSLTALAFLFAVFRSRPSPFYVMDEVEAALDDVNLHRFLQLIQEFRREAQLIIVSHQKRTMEAGDSLLGVSMQPGGSSKVVTERVKAAG